MCVPIGRGNICQTYTAATGGVDWRVGPHAGTFSSQELGMIAPSVIFHCLGFILPVLGSVPGLLLPAVLQ